MNGRIQRWQLLARLLIALAILVAGWRAGWPALGLLLAALAFWFHGLVMLGLFLSLIRINGINGGSILRLLRAWARELWVCELVFAWWQPFQEYSEPDFVPTEARGRRGVMLLHGYTCNRGLWNGWMRALRRRGSPFIALSLEPAFGSIDAYADAIEAAVQRLTSATGKPPLIVAHSMGGLAARAWWRRHGAAGRVDRIVTLGTPHAGTLMASFSPAPNARQMRRGSPWLTELAGAEPAAFAAGFDCYYSAADQIVCPSATAVLPGSRAVDIAGTGHLALLFEPRVFANVTRLLDEA